MNFKILLLGLLMVPGILFAQSEKRKAITLDACIKLALENNLDVQSTALSLQTSSIQLRQQQNTLLPSINGRYNIGVSSGRSIDPFTNDFVNERLTFSNAGLNLDAPLFSGFRRLNSWRQAKYNLEASQVEVEVTKQTLILNVTLGYLDILNAKALLKLAEARVITTERQLSRLQVMIQEETGSPVEYRNLQGQLATDKANVVLTANQLENAIINLNTLLNSTIPITAIHLEEADLNGEYMFSLKEVYQSATSTFPSVLAAQLRTRAAHKGISIAKADYTPEISLFANLNSNYSSAARLFTETGTSLQESTSFVTVNGETVPVFNTSTNFSSNEIPYFDQFENNVNTSYGVAMSLPIFNGFRVKNNVALEKSKPKKQKIAEKRIKLELKQAIEQAYNAMVTDGNRFKILQEQVTAFKDAFRIEEIRFDEGLSNSIDYVVSKNNLDTAEINLANVKFSYAVRVKILEYYRTGI